MVHSFYGWYLKCQSDTETLAVIPAVHSAGSERTCSIQIITDHDVWAVTLSGDLFKRSGKTISIGENRFGEKGIHLGIRTPKLTVSGELDFGPLLPLKYDIMGPFAFVPFMECRHSVWSMRHSVTGTVRIGGQKYSFQNAPGYWERGPVGSKMERSGSHRGIWNWRRGCWRRPDVRSRLRRMAPW